MKFRISIVAMMKQIERRCKLLKKLERRTDNVLFVNADTLAGMLDCGRATADKVGKAAGARVQIGKSVRYSVAKVQQYLDSLTDDGSAA